MSKQQGIGIQARDIRMYKFGALITEEWDQNRGSVPELISYAVDLLWG